MHTNYVLWHDVNLSVGESFDTEILEAITISHIFVAIITPNYFEELSYTYRKELVKNYAYIKDKIDCDTFRRYVKLLYFCGLTDTENLVLNEGIENE